MHLRRYATILLLSLLPITVYSAQTSYDVQLKEIKTLLDNYGEKAKNGMDYYNAGNLCYNHQLKKIKFVAAPYALMILFNDDLGNCIMGAFYSSFNPNTLHGSACYLSDSLYKTMYQPWYRDAFLSEDNKTLENNPIFIQLTKLMLSCGKPMDTDKLISLLNASTQIQAGTPNENSKK